MPTTPNGVVRFLQGVPIEADYENTHWWESTQQGLTAQTNYFAGFQKPATGGYSFEISTMTYQRYEAQAIKVQIPKDYLDTCNYMMYKNTAYSGKWFYAFIDSVDYVNDVTSIVYFTTDIVQSWWFEWYLGQCFIERQHGETDSAGDNLINEPIKSEDYIESICVCPDELKIDTIFVICNKKLSTQESTLNENNIYKVSGYPATTPLLNSYPTTIAYKCESAPGADDAATTFNIFQSHANSTPDFEYYSVFAVPKNAMPNLNTNKIRSFNLSLTPSNVYSPSGHSRSLYPGYRPKNNKLYTHPYCMFKATTFTNNEKTYAFEYFDGGVETFYYYFCIELGAPIYLVPFKYKGLYFNAAEKFSTEQQPEITYINNYLSQWAATQKTVAPLKAIADSVSAATVGAMRGGVSGGVIAGGATLLSSITGTLTTGVEKMIKGTSATSGSASSTLLDTEFSSQGSDALQNVKGYVCAFTGIRLRNDKAKMIDDYFTMFGYEQDKVGKPNIHARTRFTYVKTQGCVIEGTIPSDVERGLCDIFNKGVRFWADHEHFGDYTITNSLLS